MQVNSGKLHDRNSSNPQGMDVLASAAYSMPNANQIETDNCLCIASRIAEASFLTNHMYRIIIFVLINFS